MRSPALVFASFEDLRPILGPYIYIPPDLDQIRQKTSRFMMTPSQMWVVFGITESIQLQNQFLKFLEDYPGKVALHHEYPINVIETISSRLLSIRKKPYLPRLSFGSGISRESKNPVHDASNSLTLKACLSLPYFSPSKKKVLSLLDSL